MDQIFSKNLLSLGFEQKIDTLFSIVIDEKLFATSNKWEVFAYFENGKYYFSNNGELVESFDAPDVDIEFMLKEIKREIEPFGCILNVSKIVKEIDLDNLENDLEKFVCAVYRVDQMYKNL